MKDTFENVLTMIETFMLGLPRLDIYADLFLSSPRFSAVFHLVYQDMIHFCLAAVKLGTSPSIRK